MFLSIQVAKIWPFKYVITANKESLPKCFFPLEVSVLINNELFIIFCDKNSDLIIKRVDISDISTSFLESEVKLNFFVRVR